MSFLKTETTSRHPGGRRHARREPARLGKYEDQTGGGHAVECTHDVTTTGKRLLPRSTRLPSLAMEELRVTGRDGVRLAVRTSTEPGRPPARVRPRPRAGVERPAVGRRRRRAGRARPPGRGRRPARARPVSDKPDGGYDMATVADDVALRDRRARAGPDRRSPASPGVATSSLELATAIPTRSRLVVCVDGGWHRPAAPRSRTGRLRSALAPPHARRDPAGRARGRLRDGAPGLARRGHRRARWPTSACSTDGTVEPWLTLDRHLQVLRGLWEHDPFDRLPATSPRRCCSCRPTRRRRGDGRASEAAMDAGRWRRSRRPGALVPAGRPRRPRAAPGRGGDVLLRDASRRFFG